MRLDKGKPSGANKSENKTGVPSNSTPDKMPQNQDMTEKYTEDENDVADNVQVRHPNRNTDKNDATNAGGYKN
jgi:hypothetical protein